MVYFGDLPNINKIMALEIFVNTGQYGAGSFKILLLLQFSSDLSQT